MNILTKKNEKYICYSKLIDEMIEQINSIEIISKYSLSKISLIEKILDKYDINDDSIFIDDWLEIVEDEIAKRNELIDSIHKDPIFIINENKRYSLILESYKSRRNSFKRASITESEYSLGEMTESEIEEHNKWERSLDLIETIKT